MPVEVGFYRCTRQPMAAVAVRLADKTLAAGRRLLLAAEETLLDELDRRLWTDLPESFLAHGRSDSPEAARQPILLAGPSDIRAPAGNGASFLMLLGLPLPAPLSAWERVFLLFEAEGEAEATARAAWRALGGEPDVVRSFWEQTGGRWVKAA